MSRAGSARSTIAKLYNVSRLSLMTVCSSMRAGVRLCRERPDAPGLGLDVAKHPMGFRPDEVVRVHMN